MSGGFQGDFFRTADVFPWLFLVTCRDEYLQKIFMSFRMMLLLGFYSSPEFHRIYEFIFTGKFADKLVQTRVFN